MSLGQSNGTSTMGKPFPNHDNNTFQNGENEMNKILATAAIILATATTAVAGQWREWTDGNDYYAAVVGDRTSGAWYNDEPPVFSIQCRWGNKVSMEIDFGNEVLAKNHNGSVLMFGGVNGKGHKQPTYQDVIGWNTIIFTNLLGADGKVNPRTGATAFLDVDGGVFRATAAGASGDIGATFDLNGFNEYFKKAAWKCGIPYGVKK